MESVSRKNIIRQKSSNQKHNLPTATRLALYYKMYLSRKAEERIQADYKYDEMKTPMHMSMGEEAIAIGVCAALGNRSQIFSTYRSHAIYLARSEDLIGFFAELYGKATGPSGGKAGSVHLSNSDLGIVLSSAVVGTNIAPAVGAAFANRQLKNNKIAMTFFGDGAVDEGVFWESINIAHLWKLPVLFVYEDNGLAIHAPVATRHSYGNLAQIIKQFGCSVLECEGTDVEKIYQSTMSAQKLLKSGPVFMSFKYYRYLEHVGVNEDFDFGYRSKIEFLKWQKKDPIYNQRVRLIKLGLEDKVTQLEKKIAKDIDKAVILAKSAPFPEPKDLYYQIYDEK